MDERNVHPADEAELLRISDERRERAHEKRSLLLAELERREIRRGRDDVPRGVERECVVDAGEVRVGIFLGELGEIVGEDEADADDELHVLGGEQSQSGFAVGALARLDEVHVRADLVLGALAAAIRAVVERLVAAPADVEYDADVESATARDGRGRCRMDVQQRDVGEEKHPDEEEQRPHVQKLARCSETGKHEHLSGAPVAPPA